MKRIIAVSIVLAIFLTACASAYDGPSCDPHKDQNCQQAINNGQPVYVPLWYYRSLQKAQGTSGSPDVNGNQPTEAQAKGSGATGDEASHVASDAPSEGGSHAGGGAVEEAHPSVAIGGEK